MIGALSRRSNHQDGLFKFFLFLLFYSVVGDSPTTDIDYRDDLLLFTNTPVAAECQLYSLKQAEGVIELAY